MASAIVRWDSNPLDRALLDAFRPSVYMTRDWAKANAPTTKAGATVKRMNATSISSARADIVPTGLGFIFESGREGGYPIVPGGQAGFRRSKRGAVTFNTSGRSYSFRSKRGGGAQALKFSRGDGGFAAYAVGGSMDAEPYVRPGGELWASKFYKDVCASMLARRGFGRGNVR